MMKEVNGTLILKDDEATMEVDKTTGFVWIGEKNSDAQIHLSNDMLEALKNYLNINDLITAKRSLINLTDEQRMEVFSDYCRYCGCDDPTCRCWDDD